MSPRTQRVLQLREGAKLIVATVDACIGEDKPGPAFANEVEWSVVGQLADTAGVHLAQQFDGIKDRFGGGSGVQPKYVQELRRIAADGGIAFTYPIKEVEVSRLCKLLRFRDACRELLPRHDVFDSCEGIAAVLLGFEQSLPDLPIKPELLVDGLASA